MTHNANCKQQTPPTTNPPQPSPPPNIDDLPHPLTIYISRRDRKRIIAALRRIDTDRAHALLSALGLQGGGPA